MLEGQIVLISVLGFGIFISLLISSFRDKFEYKLLGSFLLMILLVITILVTSEMNLLREKLENTCPQYERVENVYRLKQ